MDERLPDKKLKLFSVIIIVAILVGLAVSAKVLLGFGKGGNVTAVSKASLLEILEKSDLYTIEYTYNAVARVYGDDNSTVKYYVAYQGKVNAGIDVDSIELTIDENNKSINIILPPVEIKECIVDVGEMDYIFVKEKYNVLAESAVALKTCRQDLEERISREVRLVNLAEENAIFAVRGLIEPLINQISENYTVNVRVREK